MDQQQLFVQMALQGWNTQVTRAEKLFNSYSDSEFNSPIAPGKNRIVYLYGHLAAVHDKLKEVLGLGISEKPEHYVTYVQNPDSEDAETPSLDELKQYWKATNDQLQQLFATLPAAEWFKRHNTMTDEDFERDPSRNRLSVLLNRTNHIAYHLGQVVLVKPGNAG